MVLRYKLSLVCSASQVARLRSGLADRLCGFLRRGKSPRGRAVPEILHCRVIVERDSVVDLLTAQRCLIRVSKIAIVHGKDVTGVAVRYLSERAKVRGEAPS